MILLIYLLNMCFFGQLINASKSDNNIVLSGGSGCKDSGALIMQNGQKGKVADRFRSCGTIRFSKNFVVFWT